MKKTLSAAFIAVLVSLLLSPPAYAGDPPKCDTWLNYIHKSTSAGTYGRVKVYGKTACDRPMEVITVQVSLYKDGVLLGTSPDPIELGKAAIGRSAVGPTCTPGVYQAKSEHSARLGAFVFRDSKERTDRVSC